MPFWQSVSILGSSGSLGRGKQTCDEEEVADENVGDREAPEFHQSQRQRR